MQWYMLCIYTAIGRAVSCPSLSSSPTLSNSAPMYASYSFSLSYKSSASLETAWSMLSACIWNASTFSWICEHFKMISFFWFGVGQDLVFLTSAWSDNLHILLVLKSKFLWRKLPKPYCISWIFNPLTSHAVCPLCLHVPVSSAVNSESISAQEGTEASF